MNFSERWFPMKHRGTPDFVSTTDEQSEEFQLLLAPCTFTTLSEKGRCYIFLTGKAYGVIHNSTWPPGNLWPWKTRLTRMASVGALMDPTVVKKSQL